MGRPAHPAPGDPSGELGRDRGREVILVCAGLSGDVASISVRPSRVTLVRSGLAWHRVEAALRFNHELRELSALSGSSHLSHRNSLGLGFPLQEVSCHSGVDLMLPISQDQIGDDLRSGSPPRKPVQSRLHLGLGSRLHQIGHCHFT